MKDNDFLRTFVFMAFILSSYIFSKVVSIITFSFICEFHISQAAESLPSHFPSKAIVTFFNSTHSKTVTVRTCGTLLEYV